MSNEPQTPETGATPPNLDSMIEEVEELGTNTGTISNENQFLTFVLAEESYGVDILKVQEIRGWSQVTQIPNAPEYIRGVMNLRGEIVPILDLRRRFNMNELEFTQHTVVIVVNVHERTVGMVVDSVSDVAEIASSEMRPAPDFGTAIDANFVSNLAPKDDRMIIILNVDELLQGCDLMALDEMASSSQTQPQENRK